MSMRPLFFLLNPRFHHPLTLILSVTLKIKKLHSNDYECSFLILSPIIKQLFLYELIVPAMVPINPTSTYLPHHFWQLLG